MGIVSFLTVATAALLHTPCTFQSLQPTEARYRVAVVDHFYPGDAVFKTQEERTTQRWLYGIVDLDRDWIREPYYHGDMVSLIAAHPLVSLIPYPVRNYNPPKHELLATLQRIKRQVFLGERIDAVLMSWESSTLISAFEKPLRLERAEAYKAQIRKWGESEETWLLTYEIIRTLEALVDSGVNVYTIAGNGGPGMVNTYSFANGVITVGAVEPELRRFVADNVFVDIHDHAAYLIRLISHAPGKPIGYAVNNDQCPDIPITCISGYSPTRSEYPSQSFWSIRGSSFAAPTALRRQFSAEHLPCPFVEDAQSIR